MQVLANTTQKLQFGVMVTEKSFWDKKLPLFVESPIYPLMSIIVQCKTTNILTSVILPQIICFGGFKGPKTGQFACPTDFDPCFNQKFLPLIP
jgi:hypothetical protein